METAVFWEVFTPTLQLAAEKSGMGIFGNFSFCFIQNWEKLMQNNKSNKKNQIVIFV